MRNTEREADLNRSIVIGMVPRAATSIVTADGGILTSFDLVTHVSDTRTVVPVIVEGDREIEVGRRIAVTGFINKRFFMTGGAVTSRTELRADKVVVINRPDQAVRFVETALKGLGSR